MEGLSLGRGLEFAHCCYYKTQADRETLLQVLVSVPEEAKCSGVSCTSIEVLAKKWWAAFPKSLMWLLNHGKSESSIFPKCPEWERNRNVWKITLTTQHSPYCPQYLNKYYFEETFIFVSQPEGQIILLTWSNWRFVIITINNLC